MAKKNFKEFVKEHKKEIGFGCLAVVAGVAGAVFCKKVVIPKFNTNHEKAKAAAEALTVMCEHWDLAAKGADVVSTFNGEDLIEAVGENYIIPIDGKSMRVTGMTVFGNWVET